MNWRKPTHSNGGHDACVEVANTPRLIAVRDTKQSARPDRTVITFPPEAWQSFTATLR